VSIDRFIIDRFNTRCELGDLNVNAGLPVGDDRFVQPVRVPIGLEPGPAKYRTALGLHLQSASALLARNRRHARHQFHHQMKRPDAQPNP
jgi:hypothetical protein